MVINEEERNAFTQSVMGDSEGGSSVNICEGTIDFNTGEVVLLEFADIDNLAKELTEGKEDESNEV